MGRSSAVVGGVGKSGDGDQRRGGPQPNRASHARSYSAGASVHRLPSPLRYRRIVDTTTLRQPTLYMTRRCTLPVFKFQLRTAHDA
jgi:hypothetical protein